MNSRLAMIIGIALSLAYDLFQIAMSWNNIILLSIGICSFCVAVYGLVVNLSPSEEFRLDWLKFYTIPMGILVFGQVSALDDLYVNAAALGGMTTDKILPGETLDYLLSVKALLFSYALPLITLVSFWLVNLIYGVMKALKIIAMKVFKL